MSYSVYLITNLRSVDFLKEGMIAGYLITYFPRLDLVVQYLFYYLKWMEKTPYRRHFRATNLSRLHLRQEEKIQNLTVRLASTHRELETFREKVDGFKRSSIGHFSNIWKAVNTTVERTDSVTNKVV